MTEYEQALQAFLNDEEEFALAVIDAGILADHGGYYNIELFTDGTYRLRNQLLGDESRGRMLGIPSLDDEDYSIIHNIAGTSDRDTLATTLCKESWAMGNLRDDLETAFSRWEEEHIVEESIE